MVFSEPSPKGRVIMNVEGNPGAIIARGEEITRLGRQMLDSASLLENIATRAIDGGAQKGQAIEALKESIGDSYETLRRSGELYEPVGPVITRYGDALEIYQPLLNGSAEECQELYGIYVTTPGDKDGSKEVDEGGILGIGATDEEEAQNNAAKERAYEAWLAEAERFDDYYDSWESAFEDAANGIGDEMSGSIKDSFWSDLADVLKVVGTIVAIATLFTPVGWLVGLGVAIGLAATLVTAMQMVNGEANWKDLGFAALGIIPAAKFSNVSKAGAVTSLTGSKAAGFGAYLRGLAPSVDEGIVGAWRAAGPGGVGRFLTTGSSGGISAQFDETARVFGSSRTTFSQWSRAANWTRAQGGFTGAGRLIDFSAWAGNLGLPSIEVPRMIEATIK